MSVRKPPASLVNLSPDRFTEPFWKAAAERRLVAARCERCGTFRMPPSPFCHRCRLQGIVWVELSGRGSVYSFTIVRRALIPQLEESIPYVVAVIELDGGEGVRLVSNVVQVEPDTVRIGMRVHVTWDEVRDGVVVPRFRPE